MFFFTHSETTLLNPLVHICFKKVLSKSSQKDFVIESIIGKNCKRLEIQYTENKLNTYNSLQTSMARAKAYCLSKLQKYVHL